LDKLETFTIRDVFVVDNYRPLLIDKIPNTVTLNDQGPLRNFELSKPPFNLDLGMEAYEREYFVKTLLKYHNYYEGKSRLVLRPLENLKLR